MTFVSYRPADLVKPIVEMAFGADPDGNPASWVWTDLSSRVRPSGITIMAGKGDASGQSSSTRVDVSFNNPTPGDLTPDNPMSAFWPNVLIGTPLRVSLPYGNTPPTERATVYVMSFRLRWDSGVNHSVVDVQAQGRMQRLQDTDHPIRSVLSRELRGPTPTTSSLPFAYWPMEDDAGARTAAAATIGAVPLGVSGGVTFAADSSLAGSRPLPTLPDSGSVGGAVPPYTATGAWGMLMVQKVPSAVAAANHILTITTNGSARYWTITLVPGTPHSVNIRAYDQSGTQILDSAVPMPDQAAFYGSWHMFAISAKQSGSNVNYSMFVNAGGSGFGTSGTLTANTCGNALGLFVAANSVTAGTAVGHLVVYTAPAFDAINDSSPLASAGLNAQANEWPWARFQRLCIEEGVSSSFSQAGTRLPMGPQPVGQFLDLLRECEAVDQDLMHDASPGGVLTLVARADRYNAAPTLVVDNAREQLAKGFEPVYDSTNLRTVSTVKRSGGSSATYAADTSQGTRPDEQTYSLYDDSHLYEIAGWRANSLSMKRLRYPQLGINLRKSPELQAAWLATRLGARVQAINLPQQHGPTGATVDACVEGYVETITSEEWTATLICSPAEPYNVAVMEGVGDAAWRVDTDGATLAADITATALSWTVTITAGSALFTTAGGDFPVDVDIDGERITLSGITGAASPQTFTASARSVNGVVKTHKAGAAVKGWRLRPLAL